MHRLLPLLLLVSLILAGIFYLPLKRAIVYKLGISGDPTTSCCDPSTIAKSSGNFDESPNLAIFDGAPVNYPKTSLSHLNDSHLAQTSTSTQVLGTTNQAGEEKWIEVSLLKQELTAWEGNKVVMQFLISSGKWGPTPVGTFNIWYKTRYQSMVGGSKDLGTYYNLPNVPSNMFFYQGYALHGAYWHNNFGHPMSHGCVNEPLADAVKIFDWAGPVVPDGQNSVRATPENPGTRVWVHE